jgi:hypothetical protein
VYKLLANNSISFGKPSTSFIRSNNSFSVNFPSLPLVVALVSAVDTLEELGCNGV